MADQIRRGVLKAAAATTALAAVGTATAQVSSDPGPKQLAGQPVPEPPPERSAGPIRPGRGSMLMGKVAVVTGAARGIGRAIAVEMAANGADVVAIDIAGPVSPASNAVPATPEELQETVKMIQGFGRRSQSIRRQSQRETNMPLSRNRGDHKRGTSAMSAIPIHLQRLSRNEMGFSFWAQSDASVVSMGVAKPTPIKSNGRRAVARWLVTLVVTA